MTPVSVALDWTPNTAHVGFYVAKARGWYAEAGLDISLLSPHQDQYKRTPASRVADGSCDFAVTPSETVISSHLQPVCGGKPPLVAVAALQQTCTHAIVTLKSSGIDTAAKLDGRRYASYAARYEGRIVKALVVAAGGTGDFVETVPPVLGIWGSLISGDADATWVFMGWEGVQATRAGIELNVFNLEDAGIPYGYSPVLVADPSKLDASIATAFLDATARGFEMARENPDEAARLFFKLATAENPDLPTPLDEEMCVQSVAWLAGEGAFGERWGRMDGNKWAAFVDWLDQAGLLTSRVPSRTPDGVTSASLDELRSGQAGELLPKPKSSSLFTNAFML
jgi:ABC-type nitrate/sulfonate/bicarbonate transport system substrate-binding protein